MLFRSYIQGSGKESYFRQLSSEHKALVERTLSPSGVISWREMKGRRSAIIQVTRSLPPDEEATWPAVYEWFCDATISVLRDLKPTLLNLRYEPESPEVVPDESDNHDE